MNITTERVDLLTEKRIIAGFALNKKYCELYQEIPLQYISQGIYRTIITHCIDHFRKSNDILGNNLFITLCNSLRSDNQTDFEQITDVLGSLSEAISDIDTEVLISITDSYINKKRNDLVAHKLLKKNSSAEEILAEHPIMNSKRPKMIGWSNNVAELQELLTQDEGGETLFRFDGAFGDIVGAVKRQDFICFSGFYKTGKSFFLVHTAQTAVQNGLNTLFISLEMSQTEIADRMTSWITKRPSESQYVEEGQEPDKYVRPYFTRQNSKAVIGGREGYKTPFSRAEDNLKKVMRDYAHLNPIIGTSGLVAVPRGTLTVDGVKALCRQFEQQNGEKVDVVVIDYADLLKHRDASDPRQSLYLIWEGLRSLAQQENFALFTVSQVNDEDGDRARVSDDRRKYAVVTCMVNLFREEGWLEKGILGAQQIMTRRGTPNKNKVAILHNYNTGEVVIDSEFLYNIPELQDCDKNSGKNRKSLDKIAKETGARQAKDGTFGGAMAPDEVFCQYNFERGEQKECYTCKQRHECTR